MKQQFIDSIEYIKDMDTADLLTFGYSFVLNVGIWYNLFSKF